MSTETATRDFTLEKYGRFWAVYDRRDEGNPAKAMDGRERDDPDGSLVAVTVYKKGGMEVIRRLKSPAPEIHDNPLA